ncbi:MAG: hypothetical protein ABIN55_00715 [Aeromicrobium sp.]
MTKMLKTLSTWPRLVLSGLLWGTLCGVGAGFLIVFWMVSWGVEEDGFHWDNMSQFLVGIALYSCLAVVVGSVVGGVLGMLTGAFAGLVLMGLLQWINPCAAAMSTVLVSVVAQVGIALAMSAVDDPTWWVWPIFSTIPLTFALFEVAKEWAEPPVQAHRHDTFAA